MEVKKQLLAQALNLLGDPKDRIFIVEDPSHLAMLQAIGLQAIIGDQKVMREANDALQVEDHLV